MRFPSTSSVALLAAMLATGCRGSRAVEPPAIRSGEPSEATSGPLDGSEYDIEFFGEDGASQGPSRLTFASGTFDSSLCRTHGFELSSYSTSAQGDALRFEATAKSPTHGRNEWRGTVQGDHIEGTVVSTDPQGLVDRCRFSGRRVP